MSGIVTRMLIPSHKSPVFWCPAAQTADSDFIVRAPAFPSSAFHVLGLRSRGLTIRWIYKHAGLICALTEDTHSNAAYIRGAKLKWLMETGKNFVPIMLV